MNEYIYGSDVHGSSNGDFADLVNAQVCAERPMTAERAHGLIMAAVEALAAMNFYDVGEDTGAWRDNMAAQLAKMDDTIIASNTATLPDKAADVLCRAITDVASMLADGDGLFPDFDHIENHLLQRLEVDVHVLGAGSTLGPRGRNDVFGDLDEILGSDIADWDKTAAYSAGTVVRFWGMFFKATRDISSASFFWGNTEPDKSDAWQQVDASYLMSRDILGAEVVLGMFDIGEAQLKMNGLKPVTVGAAKALIKGGLQVMSVAELTAQQHDLPMETNRQEVIGHLHWHADKLSNLTNDKQIYDSGDDAKKWSMQAYIEANSVEEGAAYLDEAWNQMWTEIGQNLADVPAIIAKLPGKVLEATTGVPGWVWYAGIAAAVGLCGYGAYKILAGPTGATLVGAYLGGRR